MFALPYYEIRVEGELIGDGSKLKKVPEASLEPNVKTATVSSNKASLRALRVA